MPAEFVIKDVQTVSWAYLHRHRRWLAPILCGFAYYLAAWLGLKASIMSQGIAIFWPANAVMLAVLLVTSPRRWPVFLLTLPVAEMANDLSSFSLEQSAGFAAANLAEVLLAASLLKISAGLPFKFDRLRHVALFGVCALLMASGIAALIGAAVYAFSAGEQMAYWDNWRIWWFGDSLGLLILTPVLLECIQPRQDNWHHMSLAKRRVEGCALSIITLVIGIWIFAKPDLMSEHSPANPMLLLPVTIWVATRFNILGTALLNLLIAVISIVNGLNQHGPFDTLQQAEHVLRLQEYLATLAFSSLALAALFQELRLQNAQLRVLGRAIDAVQEGILITDAQGSQPIIYANSGFAAITGYSVAEVIGQNPRFLLDNGSDADDTQKIRAAITSRQRVRSIVKARTKVGGTFWNQMTLDPVRDEDGNVSHYVGIHHDITEIMAAESALHSAHQQLEKTNRELEQRIDLRTRELQQANRKLAELASTDPLTGAHNRRYFLDCAHEEFKRAVRYGRVLAAIAIDIDHFKLINDQYGHAIGDKVLQELTKTIESRLRPADIFARFGGEEFFLLLPETALDEAINVAERLLEAIASLRIAADGRADSVAFTVSIGVAERNPHEASVEKLLERADQALYAAKHAGRNCIRSANLQIA
ncbi:MULTISPECIES: diguanylate cyclase [Methylomonas]|uniref:Diguanylate cyclase n=2 Tax=Methylomonas TaxID=416 RepID=A0A126T5V0_9GAMM|nr:MULTISPECIES: diguanylate cyclase [Methylomonas]AMK77452.1 hypothetical protein JT25_013340 [Methylomonas denitrificans]OAI05041.1 hypothetical protein A1342_11505 [Methylomonas methanica]TCV84508.1 PAS domain S-box-containing protein/diguanylate cyclase (GGDEF)-like protein [Methylomonas methanica]